MRDVAIHAIGTCGDAANATAFGAWCVLIAEHEALNRDLGLVIELVTVAVDEFDTVVFKRVVGGRNDDAKARTKLRTEHGHSRGGKLTDKNDIGSGGIQACGERGFQHFSGSAGVAAQDDLRTLPALGFATEHDGGGLREAHDELRSHGMTIGHGTNAVGAEELALFRHRTRVLAQDIRGVKARRHG